MLQQLKDEDRLSMLTGDILLSILGRGSSCMATRTSVLSTRWKHLPWLLPELKMDVKDFLSVPHRHPIESKDMHEGMVSLTKATRSFFGKPRRETTLTHLQLKLIHKIGKQSRKLLWLEHSWLW